MEKIPIIPLENEKVILTPLLQSDFERLYEVASDKMIWEQHPNPDRYKRDIFRKYFEGAIQSEGAFLISNAVTGDVIGSTRFYDYDAKMRLIKIGYTFFSCDCWGKDFNKEVKWLMLPYAFTYADKVHFEVGAQNIRSQKAMERLGAEKIAEQEVTYYGELPKLNFIYEMKKDLG
jgi:RimJ/RimL family protein N-acetyltransferase